MKHVLRGLYYQDPAEKDPAGVNLAGLRPDRVLEMTPSEAAVVEYVQDFHRRKGEAPGYQNTYEHFEQLQNAEAVTLIEESAAQAFRSGAAFEEHFEQVVVERFATKSRTVFQDALKIAEEGLQITKGVTTRGIDAAVTHVFTQFQAPPPAEDDQLPASMKQGKDRLRQLYDERESGKAYAFGAPSGYRFIDDATGGVKKKRLYLHAGWVGHQKTTLLVNQTVRQVVAGWNVLEFSDEMPAEEIMFLVLAIHSGDPKFLKRHAPLNFKRLSTGKLGLSEKKFFLEVQDDFVNNPDHGSLRVVDSAQFTTFGTIQQRTYREHQTEPVDILWVDYLTRLHVETRFGVDHTTAMNLSIQEAKGFSMRFDDGVGLAVCSAFQVNRDGYRKGLSNGGTLDQTCLAQYNAAEKEADLITYSWFAEEQRAANEVVLGMLKNRWGECRFDTVPLYFDPDCRRISEQGLGAGAGPVASGLGVVDV